MKIFIVWNETERFIDSIHSKKETAQNRLQMAKEELAGDEWVIILNEIAETKEFDIKELN